MDSRATPDFPAAAVVGVVRLDFQDSPAIQGSPALLVIVDFLAHRDTRDTQANRATAAIPVSARLVSADSPAWEQVGSRASLGSQATRDIPVSQDIRDSLGPRERLEPVASQDSVATPVFRDTAVFRVIQASREPQARLARQASPASPGSAATLDFQVTQDFLAIQASAARRAIQVIQASPAIQATLERQGIQVFRDIRAFQEPTPARQATLDSAATVVLVAIQGFPVIPVSVVIVGSRVLAPRASLASLERPVPGEIRIRST